VSCDCINRCSVSVLVDSLLQTSAPGWGLIDDDFRTTFGYCLNEIHVRRRDTPGRAGFHVREKVKSSTHSSGA